MTNTNTARAARSMNDHDLFHVATVLNAEVLASMATSGKGTTADLGRLELATACTDELVRRGYIRGHKVDGSDLPRDVTTEHAYGTAYRMGTPVRVF